MRTTRPLAVVAALVLGGALLAGCSASPGAGDAALDSGAGSEAAVVDGTDTSSGAPAGITPGDEDAVVEA
ncbi:MAG: hypothetical protein ACTMID_09070, partial [Cellulosimicrobium funkei]